MTTVDVALVNQFLSWRCYDDAITLAEIIFCKEQTNVNATLLAKCFHNAGKFHKAIHVLHSRNLYELNTDAKFLMADCAYKLGRYVDVEQIFEAQNCDLDFLVSRYTDLAIPVMKLLGDSYRRRNRIDQAIECYRHCLLYAPFMLTALQSLAELGDSFVDRYTDLLTTANVKKILSSSTNIKLEIKEELYSFSSSRNLASMPDIPDENFSSSTHTVSKPFRQSTCKRPNSSEALKAIAPKIQDDFQRSELKNIQQKRSKVSNLLPRKTQTRRILTKQPDKQPNIHTDKQIEKRCDQHLIRQIDSIKNECIESTQLFNIERKCEPAASNLRKHRNVSEFGSRDSIKENTKVGAKSSISTVRGPTTRLQQKKQMTGSIQKLVQVVNSTTCSHSICFPFANNHCVLKNSTATIEEMVKALCSFFQIYIHQKRNEFSKVLSTYESLPCHLKNAHWTLNQKAIAQAELGHYTSALTTFKKIRLTYPMHLQSMAIYSSVLWHLRAQNDLVNLSQVLSDINLQHPDVWCVIGNHYSISKDHDFAIQMFKRAIQLNPNFAYAYALLGNEYIVSDNHEMATSCFRILLHLDIRDYRAWYGLGSICFAREKYQLALVYFERALDVNPSSTILMCHVAVTQHIRGFTMEALSILTKAVTMDPSNSLCRFHRAAILYTLHNFEESLKELRVLEEIVPNESLVYHMFARVFRKMKNEELFLAYVNWAMKLDSKGVHNSLKDTIGRFYSCEDDHFADDQTTSATGMDSTSNGILSMSRMFQTSLNSLPLSTAESNIICSDSMSIDHRSSASDGETTDC